MNNLTNLIGDKGVNINVQLETSQIIMLSVFIFLAFFLAVLLANLMLNAINK